MNKIFEKVFLRILMVAFILIVHGISIAQEPQKAIEQPAKTSIVTKNDGTEYVGVIISMDEREILIETKELGRLYIPKHEIKSIRDLTPGDIKPGVVSGMEFFSSRYFLTTNGLRMRKGDAYALMNYYGPEIHYCVENGFTVGAMSSWIAMPIVLSLKTSFSFSENFHAGFGLLFGTLSWAKISEGGALPYGSITFGNQRNNLTLSGGYGMVYSEGGGGHAPLLSVGCLFRLTDKVSFVGDSFIYLGSEENFTIIVPGIRIARKTDRAFQIGLGTLFAEGETIPIPVPIFSWFIKL